jgi:hypothetical protein
MSTLVMKQFDLLNFVKKSKELGVPEPLAEYQGRQIEEAIEIAVASSREAAELQQVATQYERKEYESVLKKDFMELDGRFEFKIKNVELKITEVASRLELKIKDVELKIEQSRNQMIIWMTSIMATLLTASGIITHLVK